MNLDEFSRAAPKLTRNPLGIIALFIGLVYGIAGLVVGLSSKSLQPNEKLPLIYFLVLFPVIVFVGFYRLVTKHHWKFYGPGDFLHEEGFFRARQSADIIYKFDARQDRYGELWLAIESNKPILEARGGKFMEHELEGYLDLWEGLHDAYIKGLISKDMFYNAYSHQIGKIYDNPEVQAFLKESQKESPEYYTGFENLAVEMKVIESASTSSTQ